jgi:AcrR family transcriptional regulator
VSDAPIRLNGRKAQAARNDSTILEAARSVFMRDPTAPISAVAHHAGVGVSALYRRYASKEDLLRTLCTDGLQRYIAIAEAALARDVDPADSLANFLREIVDSDVHSLTVHLAGRFVPTDELHALAVTAGNLAMRVLQRARSAGAVRRDVHINDLALVFEQMAAIRLGDDERTQALRQRCLALHLDGLRPAAALSKLPGTPPTDAELGRRWIPVSPT